MLTPLFFVFFFFNDTATTEIYTLSLHDALPIYARSQRAGPGSEIRQVRRQEGRRRGGRPRRHRGARPRRGVRGQEDRKSTRLNSSHGYISYAVFCLKKKKKKVVNEDDKLMLACT